MQMMRAGADADAAHYEQWPNEVISKARALIDPKL